MDRTNWPLWAQVKHARRYPLMWTNEDLAALVAAVKREGK